MRTLHLFAGAGGGLLADLILGHEPVCAVELDPCCCAVLRARRDEGWFPGLHVHEGDAGLFDPSCWAGRVDCVAAGFPCQPFSVAGKRLGADDERDMWPATLGIIRMVRPRFVFLENVSGIVSWNDGERVSDIIGALAGMGYVGSHAVLGAVGVGAPHIRKRWWCLAERTDSDRGQCQERSLSGGGRAASSDAGRLCTAVADAHGEHDDCRGPGTSQVQRQRPTAPELCKCESEVPDPARQRCDRGLFEQETGEPQGDRRHQGNHSWWTVEPNVGRVVDGLAPRLVGPGIVSAEPSKKRTAASRQHRLAALGNGQVPIQAAFAWRILGGP